MNAAEAAVAPRRVSDATTEPAWLRRVLIGVALAFLTVFLFVPLISLCRGTEERRRRLYRRDQRA